MSPSGVSVRIAYLCNLYPAVSHSFIRREIEGVERAGNNVYRYTLRPVPGDLRDRADINEAALTESVLGQGVLRLVGSWFALLITRPASSIAAIAAAWNLSGPGLKQKGRHFAYLLEAAWLARRFRQLAIDHLHVHFGTNPAAVGLLVQKLGGPSFSFTVHGPDEFDGPIALSLRAKIEAASMIVAISSYGRSQLMRWCKPEHWNKIQVVRCGLDPAFLEAQVIPIRAESTELICVARLSAQKGLPLLIAACDRLREQSRSFSLTIIGDGELRSELELEIGRRNLENYIRLLGVRSGEEIRDHLNRARVFVLPSFAEGLPVVLMEALALGRPAITTAIAGIPELVDNECGWLIPAGSEEALVEAMKDALASTPEALSRKGEIGRDRVRRIHDARANAQLLVQLISAEFHN